MTSKQQLTQLIEDSFKLQKLIFYAVGVVAGITGVVILLLTFVMPVQPGEETIVLGIQVTSVIFIIFAIWFPFFISQRLKAVKKLIFENPDQIAEVIPYTVTRRGIPGYAVRIKTKNKKTLGFNVAGPKTQAKIVELISKR
jgi:hypothetical protein